MTPKSPHPPLHVSAHPAYDYLFVGAGASATLLLLSMERRGLLNNQRIAVIDPDDKTKNDKTFCFWAQPDDPLVRHCDALIGHRWKQVSMNQASAESLHPWQYHHIRGVAVSNALRRVVAERQIDWVSEAVVSLSSTEHGVTVQTPTATFTAARVFDSRPPRFAPTAGNQAHLLQSFIGYTIETESPIAAPGCIDLMDFSVDQLNATQFMYVLPFGERALLVELTRFGESVLTADEAAPILHDYIAKRFGNYRITEHEQGCIPMSTCPIELAPMAGVTPIGGRAGAVKPSTGYAFKTMFLQAEAIADGIQNRREPVFEIAPQRFKLYDRLLLDILRRTPELGKPIFATLFSRNPTAKVLRFLDEKTTLAQDAAILLSLPIRPFIAAWLRDARVRLAGLAVPLAVLVAVIVLVFLFSASPDVYRVVQAVVLSVGLLVVGIPHGAIDHLLESRRLKTRVNPAFVLRYLGAGLALLAVWMIVPTVALVLFIAYSAWHFGQGDVVHWKLAAHRTAKSWLWGTALLGCVLLGHADESVVVIRTLGVALPQPDGEVAVRVAYLLAAAALVWGLFERRAAIVLSALTLALTIHLPLLGAFGVYFIGQHSINGWMQLRSGFSTGDRRLYLSALPFTLGAIALFAVGLAGLYLGWFSAFSQDAVAAFFVFLSCISFPHVLAMHRFYTTR